MNSPPAGREGCSRALLLSPEPPYPLHGGGAIRTASILAYLCEHYETDLLVFRDPARPDPVPALPQLPLRRVLTVDLPVHSKSAPARAARNARRYLTGVPPLVDRFSGFCPAIEQAIGGAAYDIAIIEHFWCAPYHDLLRRFASRVVLDLHNVESVLHDRSARASRAGLLFRRWAESCRRLEREWLPRFDSVLTASPEDAATVQRLAPGVHTVVCPNGVPYVDAPKRERSGCRVVFSGNLGYHPNLAAVRYFRNRIWPGIVSRLPEAEWLLFGVNACAAEPLLQRDSRIHTLGQVEDAIAALSQCQVAVAPLLSGSGTRIKIIEAWAAGIPVVSTTVGAEGLPAEHGRHLLIADTPGQFVEEVVRLLSRPQEAAAIAAEGRRLYERCFTWEKVHETLTIARI